MRLAVFDLDHTLVPFDSGMACIGFLERSGVLPPGSEAAYLAHCQAYVEGREDVRGLHRALIKTLAQHPVPSLAALLGDFVTAQCRQDARGMAQVIRVAQQDGMCVMVTATTRPIAELFAHAFGIADLVATEPVLDDEGHFTGDVLGEPCHGAAKLARLDGWLASRGLRLAGLERSTCYADAWSDLPLLQAATDPVAVHPDARLLAHALHQGWRVLA